MGESKRNKEAEVAIAVIIYTSFRIITGDLYLPQTVRLSDRLNLSRDDFLPLRDPRIIDLQQGWVEPVAEAGPWFVPRREILVLHEVSTSKARLRVVGIPSERVPRCPVTVRAYVGAFRLEGKLHLPEDCDVSEYLNQAMEAFFPLTSVLISLPGREDLDVVQVPFALVNRSRLVVSKQVEEED